MRLLTSSEGLDLLPRVGLRRAAAVDAPSSPGALTIHPSTLHVLKGWSVGVGVDVRASSGKLQGSCRGRDVMYYGDGRLFEGPLRACGKDAGGRSSQQKHLARRDAGGDAAQERGVDVDMGGHRLGLRLLEPTKLQVEPVRCHGVSKPISTETISDGRQK